ncbi:hypothetical protein Nepgr_010630 [Nepenthes gracilis]|uniref:DUF7610 domain-containing protein n=1 Tax=Nepenthes gracilis TaxID=150966 RepID=A0AAD3XLI1_NEPGR|nr:hypothetical protein Nepgr_010630 [Nepenthes gracilis]
MGKKKYAYAILQKKLEELESQRNAFLEEKPCGEQLIVSEEMEQRISFIKNLLAAELKAASQSNQKQPLHRLAHLAHRLQILEAAFRNNSDDDCLAAADSSITVHNDVISDDLGSDSDSCPTCSCTDSCRNDDDDDRGEFDSTAGLMAVYDNPVFSCGHSALIEAFGEDEEEEERDVRSVETEAPRFAGGCGYWRGVGSAMMVGAVLMGMAMVSDYFYLLAYPPLFPPPT